LVNNTKSRYVLFFRNPDQKVGWTRKLYRTKTSHPFTGTRLHPSNPTGPRDDGVEYIIAEEIFK
jgi:hypothetical protein